jgi:hypothetical protein
MLVFARAMAIVALIGLLFSLPSIPSKYIYYGRGCGRNARIPKPIPPCHDWHVKLPEPPFPCMKFFETDSLVHMVVQKVPLSIRSGRHMAQPWGSGNLQPPLSVA